MTAGLALPDNAICGDGSKKRVKKYGFFPIASQFFRAFPPLSVRRLVHFRKKFILSRQQLRQKICSWGNGAAH
jgi:hypothetical protein